MEKEGGERGLALVAISTLSYRGTKRAKEKGGGAVSWGWEERKQSHQQLVQCRGRKDNQRIFLLAKEEKNKRVRRYFAKIKKDSGEGDDKRKRTRGLI